VDGAGYERALEQARARARAALGVRSAFGKEQLASAFSRLAGHGDHFSGYDRTVAESHISGIVREGVLVQRVEEGEEAYLVLDDTPFYPEGGGQVGDAGTITCDTGRFEVSTTNRDTSGVIYHVGKVTAGSLAVHDQVRAVVDPMRRRDAARNHTGTHLLHAALRSVLGEHVHQRGSLVAPDRLRFDYNHPEAPNPDQLEAARMLVNDRVRADLAVKTRETSLTQARAEGVTAIFGEKYGDRVRVVQIDSDGDDRPFSAELCGGTHVRETGEIGGLFIVSEGTIGSGLRRIEALTGAAAERWISEQVRLLNSAARRAGGSPADLERRIVQLQEDLAAERRRFEALQRESGRQQAGSLADQAEPVGDVRLLVARVDAPSVNALRELGDELRNALGPAVIILGAVVEDRPNLVIMAHEVDGRVHAGRLISEVRKATGVGGGGNNPRMAQGGGSDPANLPAALDVARRLAREQLAGGSR
jgi:alanyl-tRNA synthetase